MKETGNDNKKGRNAAIGAGAAIGGAAGAGGAALFTSQNAEARNVPEDEDPTFESTEAEVMDYTPEPEPEEADVVKAEPAPEPEPEPEPEPDIIDDGPEVEILGYERVDIGEGEQADVAVLDIDGRAAIIMDTNIDGEADYIAVDLNDDGDFQEEETIEVTGQGYSMAPLRAAYEHQGVTPEPNPQPEPPVYLPEEDPTLMAGTDMTDFVNDADVSDFGGMA